MSSPNTPEQRETSQRALAACQRERAFIERQRQRLIDGGGQILGDGDSWRDELSADPLAPRYPAGELLPKLGKRIYARRDDPRVAACEILRRRCLIGGFAAGAALMLEAMLKRVEVLEATDQERARQQVARASAAAKRRVASGEHPLVVVEPRPVVDPQAVSARLERDTGLSVDELRAAFKNGRPGKKRAEARVAVGPVVVELVRESRAKHPHASSDQYSQAQRARGVNAYAGTKNFYASDMDTKLEVFGDVSSGENAEPVTGVYTEAVPVKLRRKRLGRPPGSPIFRVLADVLGCSPRAVRDFYSAAVNLPRTPARVK